MLLALVAALTLPAQQLHHFRDLTLSPAGDRIATVENQLPSDTAAPDGHGVVTIRRIDGEVVRRLDPCPTCSYGMAAWSPDGRSVAFVATDAAAGRAALMVASDAAVRTVASVAGVAQTPRWSPDGATLAVLVVAGATKRTGAVEAGAPQVGEIGTSADEQRIAVVPAAGGALHLASPADTYIYEYDWLPSGTGFVATAARGNGDNNWWVAKLVAVDMAGAARVIAAPSFQINAPKVSPDGRTVAFIGGLMSDFGSVGGDLYTVAAGGGTPSATTANSSATVRSIAWRGDTLIATRLVGDQADIARIPLRSGMPPEVLWHAAVTPSAGDGEVAFSADGMTAATVTEDFEHADEIVVGRLDGSGLHPVTHVNDAVVPVASSTSLSWQSEGRTVQGWLLTPRGIDTRRKHPMITIVHGGPSAAVTPQFPWNGTIRQLLEHGYLVFQPNPRGSYGQGEAFTRANIRDFGGGDLRDILAGVDAAERVAPIDDARLGIFGHSYGGFMTMWAVTHTTRFKGAVAGAGIANWISYYGENGIDQWMIPFFGASAYDDPAVYVRASPLTTIHAARTPTLIYVGERDLECPAAQSVEFWHALKAMDVPTSLVIYAGEGHRLRRADSIHDREQRTLGWFDRYLR